MVFVTYDGYRLPTARIRCYRFADELARRGYDTKVISTVDHLGALYDGDRRNLLSDTRRVLLNMKLLAAIREHDDPILYMQKIDYHSLSVVMANRMDNSPFVLDYDDYDLIHTPFRFVNFLPGINTKKITEFLINAAEARVVSSHYLKDYFDSVRPGTHLIHTGVDTARFRPGPGETKKDEDKIIFSWAGVIWGEHVLNSLEFLFRCFSKARHARKAIVRIHGTGQFWDDCLEMIGHYSDKIQVEPAGWINPDDMPREIEKVDVGLLPLLQNSDINKAKSPTKLFEYMAMGKPTLSSRVGEVCHVIENGVDGFLVSEEEEWIECIDKLISDRELGKRMGRNAKAKVDKNYSMAVLGDKLHNVIDRVANT